LVTTINTNAFTLCSALTTIYISKTTAVNLGDKFNPKRLWTSPSSSANSDFYGAPNPVNFLLPI
jgi:hypothetical protein